MPREGPLPALGAADAVTTFGGFSNSVRSAQFHPTCDNILAVSGLDKAVTFLDCETSAKLTSFELSKACKDLPEPPAISNLSFNYDGSAYALASKDRRVRIVDPRLPSESAVVAQSPADSVLGRNLRVEWCSSGSNDNSAVLTVSVATGGMRTIHMWDPRNWDSPLCTRAIDTAAGQVCAHGVCVCVCVCGMI